MISKEEPFFIYNEEEYCEEDIIDLIEKATPVVEDLLERLNGVYGFAKHEAWIYDEKHKCFNWEDIKYISRTELHPLQDKQIGLELARDILSFLISQEV